MSVHVERLTAPAGEPFFATDVIEHCRAQGDLEREALTLATAAAAELEARFNIALLTQTVRETRDHWPAGGTWFLSVVPVLNGDQVTVTLDGVPWTGWHFRGGIRPALILTHRPPVGELVVTYEAGWATTAQVPADLRHAISDQAAVLLDGGGATDRRTVTFSPAMARAAARLRRVAI